LTVLLLQSASQIVSCIANPTTSIDSDEDDWYAAYERFYEALSNIQRLLRLIFRSLAKTGILAAAGRGIPYRAGVAGEEKDLELAAKRLALVGAGVDAALREVTRSMEASKVTERRCNDGRPNGRVHVPGDGSDEDEDAMETI
ncbi:hypothetical protein HKX48_002979, partial [Thoreauomyces humboldtii]